MGTGKNHMKGNLIKKEKKQLRREKDSRDVKYNEKEIQN